MVASRHFLRPRSLALRTRAIATRRSRFLLLALMGCTTTGTSQQLGIDPMECAENLPAHTEGWIGNAQVMVDVAGASFTATFSLAGTSATTQGSVDYPAVGNVTMTASGASGIDTGCVGKTVLYSYAWSDDCTEVGLSRDSDACELRVYNLDGVTLVQK